MLAELFEIIYYSMVPCLYRLKTHEPTSISLDAYVCVRACVRTFVSANDFAILQFAWIDFCLVAQTIFIIFPFRYKNNRLAVKIVTTK